jgi:hypothetical protein
MGIQEEHLEGRTAYYFEEGPYASIGRSRELQRPKVEGTKIK